MEGSSQLGLAVCDTCFALVPQAELPRHLTICTKLWTCPECNQTVPLDERDVHVESHTSLRCKDCGDTLDAGGNAAHTDVCLMRPTPCQWCKKCIPWLEHQNHETTCGCRKEACPDCGAAVMISQMSRHRSSRCQFPNPKISESTSLAIGACDASEDQTAPSTAPSLDDDGGDTTVAEPITTCRSDAPEIFALTAVANEDFHTEQPSEGTQHRSVGTRATYELQRPKSSLMCRVCGSTIAASLFEDHKHVCSALQRNRAAVRPFSRGTPLPAVGAKSSPNGRRPRPPPKKNESGASSPRAAMHKALFSSFNVPKDAPTSPRRKSTTNSTFYLSSEAKARSENRQKSRTAETTGSTEKGLSLSGSSLISHN